MNNIHYKSFVQMKFTRPLYLYTYYVDTDLILISYWPHIDLILNLILTSNLPQRDAGDLPPADHGSVRADQVDPAHGLLPHLHQPPHEDMEVTQFSRLYFTFFFIQVFFNKLCTPEWASPTASSPPTSWSWRTSSCSSGWSQSSSSWPSSSQHGN